MESKEMVVQNNSLASSLVAPGEIVKSLKHVQAVMAGAMTPAIIQNGKMIKDGDYGLIPGCGDKPALRKSGAEILLISFGLVAHMRPPVFKMLEGGHREVLIETEIRNMNTGSLHAVGIGSCSTMESKYRWRNTERLCPACGKPTIIKGKAEYGGGWLCFTKRGGCNAKFKDGDPAIEGQQVGREENPDIADMWNTVLKMAAKRSAVDGAIKATASSGMFTQDVDDIPQEATERADSSLERKEERIRNEDHRQENHEPAKKTERFKCKTTGKFAPAYCPVCPHKDACQEKKQDQPEAQGELIDYTHYVQIVDKLGSADECINWLENEGEEAKNNLSESDYTKLNSYVSQMAGIFNRGK
jgi:hypothetical protein